MNKLNIHQFLTLVLPLTLSTQLLSQPLPLVDVHIHYSHDAWELVSTEQAVEILRKSGLQQAWVSSSSDEGTQRLYKAAPDLVIPVLRPYRKRGETHTWAKDETVVQMLEQKLDQGNYLGIGEFHIWREDARLPVMQQVVQIAKQRGLMLHAHSDIVALEILFELDPNAIILWAHAGFADPPDIRRFLDQYPTLWAELSFRTEHGLGGFIDPEWELLFKDFPERFMVGSDPYTPERWFFVQDHAEWTRHWLEKLPPELAENIAFKNAQRLEQLVRKRQIAVQ